MMSANETVSWLAERAARDPARVALRFGSSSVRYDELHREARALGSDLARLDIGPGDVVATRIDNGEAFPRLLWALAERGAVLLPLNLRLRSEEAAYIVADAGACLLVDAGGEAGEGAAQVAARAGHLPRARMRDLRLEALPPAGDFRRPGPRARDEAQGALALIYTSGTTGRPKGAILTPAAFRASARASASLLGTGPDDCWLACMPLFHVGGLSILLRAALAGSSVEVQQGFDAGAVAAALESGTVTGVSLVATMLRRLLEARGERPAPETLRWLLLGGGPAPAELLERAHALGYPLAPTYGLTEAASQVATRLPEDTAPPLGERLQPLPGTEIKIAGAAGERLPAGRAGEIWVRGETLMLGYLGQPEATARALEGGWLHTGDLGTLDAQGGLAVLDRRDDLIVSGGENIYPAEVEAVLAEHPGVLEAAVVAEPDPEYGARPVAWWVAREPGGEIDDLAEYCRARLAGYKVPRRFVAIHALPRNAAGKVLRRELRGRSSGENGGSEAPG
ncbi:MAG: o-succinylbenzoate--CoA ligase [Myxococcota bacterium]|jgi:o-succinylbenzoate---CoA ligase|nr:o-succinylbenzoate--CoA ligase [Myxococcota bacterium]